MSRLATFRAWNQISPTPKGANTGIFEKREKLAPRFFRISLSYSEFNSSINSILNTKWCRNSHQVKTLWNLPILQAWTRCERISNGVEFLAKWRVGWGAVFKACDFPESYDWEKFIGWTLLIGRFSTYTPFLLGIPIFLLIYWSRPRGVQLLPYVTKR